MTSPTTEPDGVAEAELGDGGRPRREIDDLERARDEVERGLAALTPHHEMPG